NPLTTDQRGVGFNRISGTVDIGAFEFPNSPPDLQPQSFNAAENQTQIGTIQATDPDLPNEMLTFSLTGNGDDASLFSLSSAGVLTFLAAPDFENPADSDQDNIYEVEVLVSDQYGEMATALIPVTVTDVNEAPSIALQPVLSTIAEDVDTSSAIKIADILITDDQLGSETLSLTGNDANLFEVVGTELFLKAGAVLDFETNPALDVTVQVDDLTVGMTPDDTDSLTVLITDANEAPTITLTNVTSTLLESIDTTNRIVVETFTINDDALGSNNLSLSGDDAALFEIVGSGLFLKAGVQLNASLNPVLNVTISVDDPSLGMGAEDSAAESIEIIVPTVNLLPEYSSIIGFVNGNFWITRPSSTTLSGFQTSVAARTSFTAAEITTSVQGDFNGDGLEDVAVWLTNGEWHVGLSNTNRELEFSLWTTWRTYDVKEINVGDFNGDGLDDIAALFKAEEQANLWVFESTGTQFLPDLYGRYTGYDKILATLVGNFDGQYGDDLVIHNNSGAWWVATSDIAGTEATFSLWFRRSSDVNRSISHYQVGDFNDDGLPDVLALYDVAGSTTNFDVMVGLSTGSSFDQTSWFRMTVSQNLNAFVVGDFNGDGRTDIAALLNNRRWWVGLSNGLDEFQWSSWGVWNFAAGIQTVVVGDTNGDGRADILGRDASNYWWSAESNGVEFTTRQIVQWSSTAAWSNIHVGRFTSFGLIGSADSLIQDQSPVVKSAGTTGASPAQAESVADQILDAATFELFGASELLELLYGM
ncbi:MAG: VCBS repeat-containing protein, partial [Planctomycetaceae bacterium]|nr:VCBS repeat-containing protein [Planctomycetaceae bacterium]